MGKKLQITRTKRARDAYKAVDRASRITNEVTLHAYWVESDQGGARWLVTFRAISGMKRTAVTSMPPFWDTDVATALINWSKENGGKPRHAVGACCYFDNETDAVLMKLAFS